MVVRYFRCMMYRASSTIQRNSLSVGSKITIALETDNIYKTMH